MSPLPLGLLVALLVALLSPAHALGASPAASKDGATSLGKPAVSAKPTRAVIEHIAWEKFEGHARLVITVQGGVDYTTHAAGADSASNVPNRAYVDLRPAVLGKEVPRAPQPIDDVVAQRVRVGQFDADTVRVVVDLSQPALFEVRTSEHPARLLLGLEPRGPGAVAARSAELAAPAASGPAETARPSATAAPEVLARLPEATATPAPTRAVVRTPEPTAMVTAAPAPSPPPRESLAAPVATAKEPPAAVAAPAAPAPVKPTADEHHMTAAPAEPRASVAGATAGTAADDGAPRVALAEPRRTAAPKEKAGAKGARPQPSPRVWTVVIDPGHGGKDPGAHGVTGDEEKDITLLLSRMVAEQLSGDPQIRVVLTRSDDTYVSLEQRTAIANAQGADLFLSIHANASENPQLAGIETYTLNNTDDRATIRLAALENGLALAGATPGERDLAYILSDLVQTGKEDESVTLARAVQGNLISYLRDRWRGVANLGVKKGPFYVLVGAYMPCILVEVAFLTNEAEGQRIAARRYQLNVAEGIAQGVRRFLASDTASANL